MERAGETVYSLCVGEPDYQPPQEVLAATARAAQLGLTKYTAVNGEISLRRSISDDLKARKKTNYSPEEILVRPSHHPDYYDYYDYDGYLSIYSTIFSA